MRVLILRGKRPGWALAGLAAAALACNVLGAGPATPTPSPLPPPTAVDTVAAPTASPLPAATDTSSAPTATAAGVVTPSPTPELPDEVILVLEPAVAASVTSPVHVAGDADPTFEQNLVVLISDETGAVLATQSTTIQAEAGQRGTFDVDVPFTVVADQPGRIAVYSASARDGGLLHLASVEVTLLASGSAAVVPGQPHQEIHVIDEPAAQASVSGGSLHVSGYSEYVFESQLSLALCGEGGTGAADLLCGTSDNLIAQGVATVNSPDVGQPGPFTGDIAYTVTAPVQARLVVYSVSPRDGGILHLATVDVQLQP